MADNIQMLANNRVALKDLAKQLLKQQNFDFLSVGVVSFRDRSFFSFDLCSSSFLSSIISASSRSSRSSGPLVEELVYRPLYDLASLTKPLTLSTTYHRFPGYFDEKMILLLNHQGGLPSGGRLSKNSWKEQILAYPIKKSATNYSDYSALRLMLEIERTSQQSLKTIVSDIFEDQILFWKDLSSKGIPVKAACPVTGERNGHKIQGEVHDPNAFVLGEFCSHAGLFSSIDRLCSSLLRFEEQFHFIGKMREAFQKGSDQGRFLCGWDRVLDPENTLAGAGSSKMTFGHLGFTGTSIWIDCESEKGHVILSNATKNYWYDRHGLQILRRTLGKFIWSREF